MDSLQRKGINFDLNTQALKEYYPKGDWHIQGSGYHSVEAMSEAKAMAVIYQMTKEFPWLNYCVNVCTISDVPELFDISHVFAREAERLEKKNA